MRHLRAWNDRRLPTIVAGSFGNTKAIVVGDELDCSPIPLLSFLNSCGCKLWYQSASPEKIGSTDQRVCCGWVAPYHVTVTGDSGRRGLRNAEMVGTFVNCTWRETIALLTNLLRGNPKHYCVVLCDRVR